MHQFPRNVRRSDIAGARAIEDDLAIPRHAIEPLINFSDIHEQSVGNETIVLLASEWCAQVDDQRVLAFNDQPVQPIDADACHLKPVVEATPLPPSACNV